MRRLSRPLIERRISPRAMGHRMGRRLCPAPGSRSHCIAGGSLRQPSARRYCTASATCATCVTAAPARSAMVRATLSARWVERAAPAQARGRGVQEFRRRVVERRHARRSPCRAAPGWPCPGAASRARAPPRSAHGSRRSIRPRAHPAVARAAASALPRAGRCGRAAARSTCPGSARSGRACSGRSCACAPR